ncbi:LuxR family transcriptional regulator [Salinarimonas rosea]|uniref:LuxR family transcriptional regulator n=1 Tax=Salinarimonas rosea TaxID=552063 RepID=UPI00040CB3A4|nr:LuxR family transcriptional regulator [Salinarimonas rosea]
MSAHLNNGDLASDARAMLAVLSKADEPGALLFELGVALGRFGVENIVVATFERAGSLGTDAMLLQKLPKDWLRTYVEHEYGRHDPVLRLCTRTKRSFAWTEAERELPPNARSAEVMAAAGRHGMTEGLCVPIHGRRGLEGCVSVSGAWLDIGPRVRPVIDVVARGVFDRCREMASRAHRSAPSHLTRRERDVLYLAARGLSAGAAAAELGISERTVTTHMTSACRKLDAPNKTAAVATAILRDLLGPAHRNF